MIDFNFYAPYNTYLGYGVHARNLAAACHGLGATVRYRATEKIHENTGYPFKEMLTNRVNHTKPTVVLGVASQFMECVGSRRIGYTVFEIDRVKSGDVASINEADEFWVTSNWGKTVAEESGVKVPITVIPEGVDTDVFTPDGEKLQLEPGVFRFLAVGKMEPRKGYDILLKAFSDAFGGRRDVELVLKCDNVFTNRHGVKDFLPDVFHALQGRIIPRMSFVPMLENRAEMARVYRSSDAFVLPTRGEGWGLPIQEAMASGLPVITTNWSAPTEYLTDKNACLLEPGELIPADDPVFGSNFRGGKWANPSVESVKEALIKVFEDAQYRTEISKQAREDCVNKWTWKHAAKKAMKALE